MVTFPFQYERRGEHARTSLDIIGLIQIALRTTLRNKQASKHLDSTIAFVEGVSLAGLARRNITKHRRRE